MTKKEITKKDDYLAITKTYDLAKPTEVLEMAVVLKNLIIKQNLYTNIKGKNYAMVEGWQIAGFLTGLAVIVEEPKDLSNDKEVKWSCTAKIYAGDKIVGVGYALCSNKEVIKKSFDEYAILSMAQTRAIGKAYRNKIGWVMKLAGYESTPSEEMVNVANANSPTPTAKPTQIKAEIISLLKKYGAKTDKESILTEITRLTGMEISDKSEDLEEIKNRLEVLISEMQ